MKRKIYLKMKSLEGAQNLFWSHFNLYLTGEEKITSRAAGSRITSRPVVARFSSPSFHAAAMDGIAVNAEDTYGAADDAPVSLNLKNGQAVAINTGHPLPDGRDAVIMIENVLLDDNQEYGTIRAPIYPWQNVRKIGEDIVATELLFPTHHQLKPADLGALITAGCSHVWVRKKPKVLIIPTGNELVPLEEIADTPPPGKTVESNSVVLAALAEQAGAVATVHPIIEDNYETIKKHLLDSVRTDADMIVVNAGSSAGSADYTVKIIEELGVVLVHGVTIMPGKPTILGEIEGKPVVGNPGYPVSALISFEQFVMPLLNRMQGMGVPEPQKIRALLARNIPSRAGMEEFRRMITGQIGAHNICIPLKKGAGAITTITRANSILRIPAPSEGVSQGSVVELELLRPFSEIERTILCTGSHDLTLDLLHDFLKKGYPSYSLASTHVGSLGGIMAVKAEMTHIAGSHLLDPQTGDYNIVYLKQYLPDRDVALITLAHRQQGFMVQPGNPKNIKDVKDLVRDDVAFINRQAGSGTRVLLDYEMEKSGLTGTQVRGYDNEEYTHMSVAVAVLSGKADAGLGILAAARALGLDFIPVTEERYDLVISEQYLSLPSIRQLLNIVCSGSFKEAVEKMGGYATRETGKKRMIE